MLRHTTPFTRRKMSSLISLKVQNTMRRIEYCIKRYYMRPFHPSKIKKPTQYDDGSEYICNRVMIIRFINRYISHSSFSAVCGNREFWVNSPPYNISQFALVSLCGNLIADYLCVLVGSDISWETRAKLAESLAKLRILSLQHPRDIN